MIFFWGNKSTKSEIGERDNAKCNVNINNNILTILNLEKFVWS